MTEPAQDALSPELDALVVDIDADDVALVEAPSCRFQLGGKVYVATYPDEVTILTLTDTGDKYGPWEQAKRLLFAFLSPEDVDDIRARLDEDGEGTRDPRVSAGRLLRAAQKLEEKYTPYMEDSMRALHDEAPVNRAGRRQAARNGR